MVTQAPVHGGERLNPARCEGLSWTQDEPEFSRDPVCDQGLVSRPAQQDTTMRHLWFPSITMNVNETGRPKCFPPPQRPPPHAGGTGKGSSLSQSGSLGRERK